jgi:hypothetical protein
MDAYGSSPYGRARAPGGGAALEDAAFSLDDFLQLAAFSPLDRRHPAGLLATPECAPARARSARSLILRCALCAHARLLLRRRCSFSDALLVAPDNRLFELECQLQEARKEARAARGVCRARWRSLTRCARPRRFTC